MDDRSQGHSKEIPYLSCDLQKELFTCLEQARDVIEQKLAEEETVDDPAEVVLDRIVVLLDWTVIPAVMFLILGTVYLRSPAIAVFGDATTHELVLKLTQITKDAATRDMFLALLARTPSPESPRFALSRGLAHISILSSSFVIFLIVLGKLFMGCPGLHLTMSSRRIHKCRRQYLPGSSRGFILALKPLPHAFLLAQFALYAAIAVAHHFKL